MRWIDWFWKIVPHKFYPLRGSSFCGRCGINWSLHLGAGRPSW